MMWGPDPEKVQALMSHLGGELERIVREKLFGDAVDVALGLKTVGATVVMAAAVRYARKAGLPLEAVANIVSLSYRALDIDEGASANQSPPKSDDE